MISFDEAVDLIASVAHTLGTETVALDRAAGRVLAAPVKARIDSPRSDVSAMDGYAVRDADLSSLPARLRRSGESFPGSPWLGEFGSGRCVRIFTGAVVPHGADRVVIQEDVRREGDIALIDAHPGEPRHIRGRGSDFAAGEELLGPGALLSSRSIVTAAAADIAELDVYRQPRVVILSAGDELAEPGSAHHEASAIPDSVSLGVAALAQQWGAPVVGRHRLPDDLEMLRSAAAEAVARADVVVVTGGASVGERDFARPMFEPLGMELVFSKVAMKPGKPAWLGRVNDVLVVGLPGNPTSALVTARLLLAPLLAGMCGQPIESALQWRRIPIADPLPECGARETFHRARWDGDRVTILPNQDSGAQKMLAQAELLVRQRRQSPALQPGDLVAVLDF